MQNKDTTTTKTAYQQLKYQNQAWQHTLILTQFQTRSELHFSTRYNSRGVLQNSAIHLLHSLIHPHKHTPKDTNLSLAWINFWCEYRLWLCSNSTQMLPKTTQSNHLLHSFCCLILCILRQKCNVFLFFIFHLKFISKIFT